MPDKSISLQTNLNDPATCLTLLSQIKHTRLEGLIIEYEVEQIFSPWFAKNGWMQVNALTLRRVDIRTGQEEFLVLPGNPGTGVALLIEGLRKTGRTVRSMEIIQNELFLINEQNPQEKVALKSSRRGVDTSAVAINDERILAMYWGFGRQIGKKFEEFLQQVVIKDFYISPISRFLWDLDMFLISPEGTLYYLEVKHKYPARSNTSGQYYFGMNRGEVHQNKILRDSGVNVWHIILVKPRWQKDISSMYLYYDREARQKALWIAGDFTKIDFGSSGSSYRARQETSLNGRSFVSYTELNLECFHIIGPNSMGSDELAKNLLSVMYGKQNLPVITGEVLDRFRMK